MMASCADLPFFLRECDKVPPHDDVTPVYRNHKIKAFEVVVSLEILLNTKDAADLFLKLLLEDSYAQHVIWLSDDVFIFNGYSRFGPIYYSFKIELVGEYHDVKICKVPSANNDVENQTHDEHSSTSAPSLSLGPDRVCVAVDTCLHLLAKHKTITAIEISQHIDNNERVISAGSFPASLDALQAFVGEAKSPRKLWFDKAGLSIDQWRVITTSCNTNVQLSYRVYELYEGMQALIEAMKCNQCPSQLDFQDICNMHTDVFQEFVSALESASSLKDLEIHGHMWSKSKLIPLCNAVARNHGLQRLELFDKFGGQGPRGLWLSDTQWELASKALASHPNLRTLTYYLHSPRASFSPERDQIMIQYISKNRILRKFTPYRHAFHDSENVEQAVRPFLEFNRFWPVVEAMKQETDLTRRKKLFTSFLLSDHVSQRLAFRFLLLKEHSDLLAELSWPDNVLLSRWNRSIARVLAIEEEMQNRELLLPSLERLSGKKRRR